MKRVIAPGIYQDSKSGTYFRRPVVAGKRTWRKTEDLTPIERVLPAPLPPRADMPVDADEVHMLAEELFRNPRSQSAGWQLIFQAMTGLRTGVLTTWSVKARLDIPDHCEPAWRKHSLWYCRNHPNSIWWFPGLHPDRPINKSTLSNALPTICDKLKLPHRTTQGLRAFYVNTMRFHGFEDGLIALKIGCETASQLRKTYPHSTTPTGFMPVNRPPAWDVLGLSPYVSCRELGWYLHQITKPDSQRP